jgi:predicted Zn-dependent peptidase
MSSLLTRMQVVAFPAGHPLHDEKLLPPGEVRLDEVARQRDAELRPETLTLCFAGGVTRDSLSPILERTAGAMKAKGAAPAPKKIPQVALGKGVFLFEAPEGEAAGGLLTPAPMLSSIDYPAFALAFRVAQAILSDERKEEDGGAGEFYVLTFPDTTLFAAVVSGSAPRVSSYVTDTLAALKRVGEGQFTAETLARARREVTKQTLDLLDRTPDIAARLADVAQYDWPADNAIRRYNAALVTPREDVIKVAQRWFAREEARIVAAGKTEELEAALEPVGITPVAIVPEGSDKGKKGKGKTK